MYNVTLYVCNLKIIIKINTNLIHIIKYKIIK